MVAAALAANAAAGDSPASRTGALPRIREHLRKKGMLAKHAIDRIEAAMDAIDDSNGECSGLLDRARDIHLAAARAARPEPIQLAGDLFVRETEGDYDTFYRAGRRYEEVLGEAGLAEYRRLALEARASVSFSVRGHPVDSGTSSRVHLRENLAAAGLALPAEAVAALDAVGAAG